MTRHHSSIARDFRRDMVSRAAHGAGPVDDIVYDFSDSLAGDQYPRKSSKRSTTGTSAKMFPTAAVLRRSTWKGTLNLQSTHHCSLTPSLPSIRSFFRSISKPLGSPQEQHSRLHKSSSIKHPAEFRWPQVHGS